VILSTSIMPIPYSFNISIHSGTRDDSMSQTFLETTSTYGGRLRVGWWYLPQPNNYLNPLLSGERALGPERVPVFNGLTRVDENGVVVSELAKSWEREGLNYTFYLNDNVTWHDGALFDADDVKFTFDTILNDTEGVIDNFWKTITSKLESVKISNSTTVVFQLTEPEASFLYSGTPIIPQHVYEGNLYNNMAVGTGAFKVQEWHPTINMTLIVNEEYFRGRANLDSILFRWDIPREQLADSLLNNTIDFVPDYVDPNRIEELQQISGISTTTIDELAYFSLGCNLRRPLLNNSSFRKALAYAVNKTKIIEVAYLGYAKEATGPLPPALSYWYNPNVIKYRFNATKAQQMLQETGYSGEPLSLKIPDDDPLRINASQIIIECWEELGVNATLVVESRSQWAVDLFIDFNFDITLVGWGLPIDPDILPLYHSDSNLNLWNYSNSELDTLLEQGKSEYNDTQRKAIYDQVQAILAEDIPTIFLYHRMRRNAYNNDFHNFTCTPQLGGHTYSFERVYYEETLSGQGKSPVVVCFLDEFGRRSGFHNGSIFNEIPRSAYDEEANLVKTRSPSGNYTVEVCGTGNGTYSLEIVNIALGYKYSEIPLNTIHMNQTRTYLVQVFSDGLLKVWDPLLDIVEDWNIDMRDVGTAAQSYGSYPGHLLWNKAADVYEDDNVDMRDIGKVAREYGDVWP